MWRRFSEEERQTIWDMRDAGVPVKRIAKHLGRQNVSLRKFIADAGGKRPTPRQRSEALCSEQHHLIDRQPARPHPAWQEELEQPRKSHRHTSEC